MAYTTTEPEQDEMKLSDEELLSILAAEKQASVGFENGTELEKRREKALEYYKGEMKDVPSLPNRSSAKDSTLADAVETALPDIMEILTGGEDVASFEAVGPDDEEKAKQETDWVVHKSNQLGAFILLHTAVKDALLTVCGVLETWREDKENLETESYENITAVQLDMLKQSGYEITEQVSMGIGPDQLESFNVKAEKRYTEGCVKSAAVDSSNLTVATDTIDIAQATYCAVRSFPRAQSLIERGFDKDKVALLPDYPSKGTEQTERARDAAGESTSDSSASSTKRLRSVEVHKHWLRVDADEDGKTELWCVHTDSQCKVLLDKRRVNRIGLAVGTPFLLSHRLYGIDLADKLVEVQKIKTALMRMMLDSGYFALNQRVEVSEERASENTIADLLRNEPGVPVRSRTGDAVKPIVAGQLGFDALAGLEQMATVAEMRAGIVRNAQGLNPDTLHDTKGGMDKLVNAAQKRLRFIARVLVETLVKKWYLDIHAFSREGGGRMEKIRLRGKWVDIDPSEFGDRSDMVVEVGSGGKENELIALREMMGVQKEYVLARGGFGGIVQETNFYNTAKRFTERSGFRNPDLFWTDPTQAPPEPPKPDPEMMKAQAKIQGDQMKAQSDHQIQQAKLQGDMQRSQAELEMDRERMQMELQMKREQLTAEFALKREQLMAEMQLKREIESHKMANGFYDKPEPAGKPNGSGGTSTVHMGGEPG